MDVVVLFRPCVIPTKEDVKEEHNPLETSAWKMPQEISLSAHRSQHPEERVGDVSDTWELSGVNVSNGHAEEGGAGPVC